MKKIKLIDNYVYSNLKRLYIIEHIYLPILNSLHPWKPFNLFEYNNLLDRISKLHIGVNKVEFYNEKLQKYKPYNLDISRMVLKCPTDYDSINNRIEKLNELYPEKITHLNFEFEISNQILLGYKKSFSKNQPTVYHNDITEQNLLHKLLQEDQDALKTLINLYQAEFLQIAKTYIHYNINPIQEGIIGFYNASRIYEKEKHGEFKTYIINWVINFINQAAQESLRINPLNNTL